MIKINLGAGGNILEGHDNLDKYTGFGAKYLDFDNGLLSEYQDSSAELIVVHGCLNEFAVDVVTSMNEFWRVLCNGGKLDIVVAVVDNGIGPFRDPMARRYLSSEWVQYFLPEDLGRYAGGRGFGFKGAFRAISNEVAGERHAVILEAVK